MSAFCRVLGGAAFALALALAVAGGTDRSAGPWGYPRLQLVAIAASGALGLALLVIPSLARRARVAVLGVVLLVAGGFAFLRALDYLTVRLAHSGAIPSAFWPAGFDGGPDGPFQRASGYNAHLGLTVEYRTNELGFRGGPLRPEAKKILLLGGSVMFGVNIPEETTYAAVLERMLGGGVQVLNGAWPGTATFRQEQTLIRYLYSVPSRLQAVVVGYLDDDPPDNLRFATHGVHRMDLNKNVTRFDSSSSQELLYREYVYPLFMSWEGLRLLAGRAGVAWARAPRPTSQRQRCRPVEEMDLSATEFARGIELTVAGVRRMTAMAAQAGARTYVLYFPAEENDVDHVLRSTWASTGRAAAYNRLKQESRAAGYVFIDGLAAVAEHVRARGLNPCRLSPEYYSWPEDFTHSSPLVVQIITGEMQRAFQGKGRSGRSP